MKKTIAVLALLLLALAVWGQTYTTSVLEFDLSKTKAVDIAKVLSDYTQHGYSIVTSYVHEGVLFVILQARVK